LRVRLHLGPWFDSTHLCFLTGSRRSYSENDSRRIRPLLRMSLCVLYIS
jgi:hypothetical protein